jgi:hypothetical protein
MQKVVLHPSVDKAKFNPGKLRIVNNFVNKKGRGVTAALMSKLGK